MAYKAYIVELPEPRKHTNADRLQCFEVYGQNVITDLKYHEGQKCVYFPVDGQLSERFCEENNLLRKKDADGNNIGGYMDPSKRNITAIRLRKEKSEGLVLPIEVLSPYCDVTKLVVGQAISEFGDEVICRKYIPIRRNQRGNGGGKRDERKKKVKTTEFPFFEPHVDTEQLAYNQDAFHEGDLVYLTRKLHGTSFRVGNTLEEIHKKPTLLQRILHPTRKEIVEKKWKVVGGTRKVILDDDYSGGYYGSNEFRKKYTEQLAPILPKGVTIYGELVGYVNDSTPIMPVADVKKVADKDFRKRYGDRMVFDYGCEPGESHAYIYRMTITNEDGEVFDIPHETMRRWCANHGLDTVPYLERFFYTTWEDLNARCEKYLDQPEPLSNGTHITEGVVVTLADKPRFTAYKTKGFWFKCLAGIAVDNLTDEQVASMDADLLSEV